MKILVKFPTRSRPQKFLSVLKQYIETSNPKNVSFLVTCDVDDKTMTPDVIKEARRYPNVDVIQGISTGKVHACNRDISQYTKWDILVLASDDMIPQVNGWDEIIINRMKGTYPKLDGVLFFSDGYVKERLNTMCIMGRKYFDHFGYIYHPSYLSLWCDNEFTDVANIMDRQTYFNDVLFKHEHPANTGAGNDEQYRISESFYHQDKANYEKRKAINFGL